jgi:hypothetical protein
MIRFVSSILLLSFFATAMASDRYINIVSPEVNATIDPDTPVTVSGTGRGMFEGNVVVRFEDLAALELGRRVEAVREAIQHPGAPDAMQAITDLGYDQRYYVMLRGWLAYQRQGDRGIVDASRGQAPEHIKARVRFLDQAIRAIDLE